MKSLFVSWKTTVAGLGSILGGVALLLTAAGSEGGVTGETLAAAITAITAGVGLLTARDSDKSSRAAGAR